MGLYTNVVILYVFFFILANSTKNSKNSSKNTSSWKNTKYISECELPTERGLFKVRGYRHTTENKSYDIAVVISGDVEYKSSVPLRIHDQCLTSEVLGSRRCDCREQLHLSLDYINKHNGVVIYLLQEGRGIGLANKIAAYSLQDSGLDTVDANRHLGFYDDERSYDAVPVILNDLHIQSIQLMTNNPRKIQILLDLSVKIDDILPVIVEPNGFNFKYLLTKVKRMSHVLPLQSINIMDDARNSTKVNIDDLRLSQRYQKGRHSVEAAIHAIRNGLPVIVTDDVKRENEGDIILAAELATPEALAFMVRYSSGVICVSMDHERLTSLQLPPMTEVNEDPKETAFTVSVDVIKGTTTGISAVDRALTSRALANPDSVAADFHRPGHMFPLRARKGGVLARAGHTEASIDLAKMAGLQPVGLLAEIVSIRNPNEMARMDELEEFSNSHSIVMTTIEDIIVYKLEQLAQKKK
eukprot:GHVL01017661.1.p1 GENE.GHVL01017661.1~~GHVL01017661.1.p1  ORF type:complete len:469 (+),score=92.64 GHVL01017661.1:1981-3387(+)